ncbi:uncharacterized protein LOC128929220 isoform X2 [Callithrix jacchus]
MDMKTPAPSRAPGLRSGRRGGRGQGEGAGRGRRTARGGQGASLARRGPCQLWGRGIVLPWLPGSGPAPSHPLSAPPLLLAESSGPRRDWSGRHRPRPFPVLSEASLARERRGGRSGRGLGGFAGGRAAGAGGCSRRRPDPRPAGAAAVGAPSPRTPPAAPWGSRPPRCSARCAEASWPRRLLPEALQLEGQVPAGPAAVLSCSWLCAPATL